MLAESPGRLHTVGHTHSGERVLATAVSTGQTPTVVYLHEWDGTYRSYELSGGP